MKPGLAPRFEGDQRSAVSEPRGLSRRYPVGLRLGLLAILLASGAVAGSHFFWHHHLKRFQAVRPDVFYRSAQPTPFGLRYLIRNLGVRTVLSLRGSDPLLSNDVLESNYTRRLGASHLHWPILGVGESDAVPGVACWPWPAPWQLEQFIALMDDSSNWPVAVHCVGGRHRAGTFSALFRLEYDRWSVEDTLAELHAFRFGDPVPIHDLNLRTYVRRPRPGSDAQATLARHFAADLGGQQPAVYEELVQRLRRATTHDLGVQDALKRYLLEKRPFGVALAQRIVDRPDHPLAESATRTAAEHLVRGDAGFDTWASSAALIADYGTLAQQRQLLDELNAESTESPPTPRYQALVAGVTNRYASSRIPYLRPLLDDDRRRPEPASNRYRYCDTAVARLSVILNEALPLDIEQGRRFSWKHGRERARDWFETHPEATQLTRAK